MDLQLASAELAGDAVAQQDLVEHAVARGGHCDARWAGVLDERAAADLREQLHVHRQVLAELCALCGGHGGVGDGDDGVFGD